MDRPVADSNIFPRVKTMAHPEEVLVLSTPQPRTGEHAGRLEREKGWREPGGSTEQVKIVLFMMSCSHNFSLTGSIKSDSFSM